MHLTLDSYPTFGRIRDLRKKLKKQNKQLRGGKILKVIEESSCQPTQEIREVHSTGIIF